MKFKTSSGQVISELRIRDELTMIIERLERYDISPFISSWGKEFLEWYLDKKIDLDEGVTEEELGQLKQLIDYLEL